MMDALGLEGPEHPEVLLLASCVYSYKLLLLREHA